jgi:YfiH family protein
MRNNPREFMFAYHFFSRDGGVSPSPFASLNLSHGVGDVAEHVIENRERVKFHFGSDRMVCTQQVHGERIYRVEETFSKDTEVDGFDALVTNLENVVLLIQQADCQAVLLHDPERQVVAAVHCGWRGSVAEIIGKTVSAMQAWYQSAPAGLSAWIGPSLGPCCAEFINFRRELPAWMYEYQVRPTYFDFWEISRQQLLQAGLIDTRISIGRQCTCCTDGFFSYRRACRLYGGVTGRHGSAIRL